MRYCVYADGRSGAKTYTNSLKEARKIAYMRAISNPNEQFMIERVDAITTYLGKVYFSRILLSDGSNARVVWISFTNKGYYKVSASGDIVRLSSKKKKTEPAPFGL